MYDANWDHMILIAMRPISLTFLNHVLPAHQLMNAVELYMF